MKPNCDWPRPAIRPMPEDPARAICLNGPWRYAQTLPADFARAETEPALWQSANVPCQMKPNPNPYAFAREVAVPAEWRGMRLFLRFDGANCLCDAYVNGRPVGSHYGGFVTWETEITDFALPGNSARVAARLEDRAREVNTFHFGGLIRDVYLYALPALHMERLQVETEFDAAYQDATLKISYTLRGGRANVAFSLLNAEGAETALGEAIGEDGRDARAEFRVPAPEKWDSEHPHLYTLLARFGGETARRRFGFRQIRVEGREMYVNGQRVKLRGVNRHDTHPLTGRAITRELCETDIRLFKQANINFIRTSHYPPRPDFLDLCDEYGMYVEDEIAVAFLGYGASSAENDPERLPCFMGQFADMIERDFSHPSVILWSLANESHWGDNLEIMNTYAHKVDPARPTIFSFPFTQPDDAPFTDIWSVHYGKWDTDLAALRDSQGRSLLEDHICPVLHDESTHIPCYNREELARDPGVRDFWGETISRFWTRIWQTGGALGCAIWAGIDDTRMTDTPNTGPAWGVIDGWRRKKPEWWHMRKAFSPVYIAGLARAVRGGIEVPVENRFNHTRLDEVLVRYQLNEICGELRGPALTPGESGALVLPVLWRDGARLEARFFDAQGLLVQELFTTLNAPAPALPRANGGAPKLSRADDGGLWVEGEHFRMRFSGETGLIALGEADGLPVITGGPYLTLTGLDLGVWTLARLGGETREDCAEIAIEGAYDDVRVRFNLRIDAAGRMETTCAIVEIPYASPRRVAISSSICAHAGGYSEVGIAFDAADSLRTLKWEKRGIWTEFPDWHIGRLSGSAPMHGENGANLPGKRPGGLWKDDEVEYGIAGRYALPGFGTFDFRSMKSRVLRAGLFGDGALVALSNGAHAVRAEANLRPENVILNTDARVSYKGEWKQIENRHHTKSGSATFSRRAGDTCEIRFCATGIAWFAMLDKIGGKADVFIDGARADSVDLGINPMQKNPRCYLRAYNQLVYAAQNLTEGWHTLKIEVLGEKGADSSECAVNANHFLLLNGRETLGARLHILSAFNYPLLSWANYENPPIQVKNGHEITVYTRLAGKTEAEEIL